MNHSPGFPALVNDAKQRVTEVSVVERLRPQARTDFFGEVFS